MIKFMIDVNYLDR